jgi:hypothetical protein
MFQLRIIFTERESRLPNEDAPISVLIQYGRQYLVEMGICADKLAEEVDMEAAAGGAEDNVEELRAELQRTQWAACIWELALIMLVMRPLVAGAAPWPAVAAGPFSVGARFRARATRARPPHAPPNLTFLARNPILLHTPILPRSTLPHSVHHPIFPSL